MKKIFNTIINIALAVMLTVVIFSPYNQNAFNVADGNNEQENSNFDVITDDEDNTQNENAPPEEELSAQAPPQFTYIDNGMRVQALVNLNVRAQPSQNAAKIGTLNVNKLAGYIETINESWYKVYFNNTLAYVSSNSAYSKIIDSNKIKNNENIINKVIDTGMNVLGIPYEFGSQRILLWNGNLNPDFTGKTFDCSAFIQYIYYKGAGIKLSGDSRSQSKNGINVDLNNIIRGDIIIMTSTQRQYNTGIERIGHVAIYIGDNKILHTFGTGGVRIQDYSAFWKGRSITARRIVY